jgi:hypothetical protein
MVTLKILDTSREGRAHFIGRQLTITGGFTFRPLHYDDEIPTSLEDATHYHATDGDTDYILRDVRGWFRKQMCARYRGVTQAMLTIATPNAGTDVCIYSLEILAYADDADNAKGKMQNAKDDNAAANAKGKMQNAKQANNAANAKGKMQNAKQAPVITYRVVKMGA